MTKNRLTWGVVWPWLLLLVPLTLGPLLGSCASSIGSATPTPTKIPKAAAVTPPPANQKATAVSAVPTVESSNTPLPAPTAEPQGTAVASPAVAPVPSPTTHPIQTVGDGLMSSPDFAVQAFLWWREEVADRDLQLIRDADFGWVKQYSSWQDIEGAGRGEFDWTGPDGTADK